MLLPLTSDLPNQPPVPVLPTPVVLAPYARQRIDKALVDKALTIKTIESLDVFFDTLKDLALEGESESTKLEAIKYLLDRAAGKAAQQVTHSGTVAHVHVTPDEIKERLAHLNGTPVPGKIYAEGHAEEGRWFHDGLLEEGIEGEGTLEDVPRAESEGGEGESVS